MSPSPATPFRSALHGAMLDIRGWLQRVGVTVYCYVFLGCPSVPGPTVS